MATLSEEGAARVADMIESYNTEGFESENIMNILANLMHYCDKNDLDFDADLESAKKFFEEERD